MSEKFQISKPKDLKQYVCLEGIAVGLTALIPAALILSRAVADGLLTTVSLLFLIHCLRSKAFHSFKQPIFMVLGAFWGWMLVGSLLTPYNVMESLLHSLAYVRFLIFFVACWVWLFESPRHLYTVVTISGLTLAIVSVDAVFQFITGFSMNGSFSGDHDGRLTSFLNKPSVGMYLGRLTFPVLAGWLFLKDCKRRPCLVGLTFLCGVVGVICLTGERTATLLSLFALLVCFCGMLVFGMPAIKRFLLAGILLLSSGLGMVVYSSTFLKQRVWNFTSDLSHFWESPYGQLFTASFLIWKDQGFFTGIGVRQFRHACLALEQASVINFSSIHSHNIYLELLSETGLVGLILFLTFLFFLSKTLWDAFKTSRQQPKTMIVPLLMLGGWIVVLFPFSITVALFANWSATLNWFALGLSVAVLKKVRLQRLKRPAEGI